MAPMNLESTFNLSLIFWMNLLILLVGMIGAITLTFNKRDNIKRQSYFNQIQRNKESGVKLVEIKSNKGVEIDE